MSRTRLRTRQNTIASALTNRSARTLTPGRKDCTGAGMRSLLKGFLLPLALLGFFNAFSRTFAEDWPQWRGPERNGISKEKGWTTKWPKQGPKKLCNASVG